MNNINCIEIKGKRIGLGFPTYFIADIAANHDGDLSRAKDLIWLAKDSGADAAKFQHFKAETIVSDFGFKKLGKQKSHQANWGSSVYEVYKAASIDLNWTQELKDTCDKADITFMTSPYAFDLVDEVDTYVSAYKIGSGDITWLELIEYIAKKNKPYILATGASSLEDVSRAVQICLEYNTQFALLQCNTNYTGSINNMKFIHLNVLKKYREIYPNLVLGLSDHTPGHSTVLGAISLGARVIEKHFTDNCLRIGPDHAFSMDPNSWKTMVNSARELEAALGLEIKKIEENEEETVILQRRAIRVKIDVLKGQKITSDIVEMLRPCPKDAMPPYSANTLYGKFFKKNLKAGDYIKANDVDDK